MPHDIHTDGSESHGSAGSRSSGAASWANSLFDLVNSRIAIFQIEAKQAAARKAGRLMMLAGAAFAAVFAWLLLMAAISGVVHAFTSFAWYWTCLVIAGIHLLVMAALLRAARAQGPPSFEHTRSEFNKDREWLQNLHHRKSKP